MKGLMMLTGCMLAIVSGIRSALWLMSYATTEIDQGLAIASATGMTLAMFLLSASAAEPDCPNPKTRNAAASALFMLSIWATMDWAESGFTTTSQALASNADMAGRYSQLADQNSQNISTHLATTSGLAAVEKLSKSAEVQAQGKNNIPTQLAILDRLKAEQAATPARTGNSAQALGEYRWILWIVLGSMLDIAGALCLRATINTNAASKHDADSLTQQIRDEISQNIHGSQPAVKRVAHWHNQPPERIRQIFQQLLEQGFLTRNGIRYQQSRPRDAPNAPHSLSTRNAKTRQEQPT